MLNNVNRAYYINLDCRTDRRELMENFFDKIKIPSERIPAILTRHSHFHGHLFCSAEILRKAIERDEDYIMLCDDDVFIETDEKFDNFIKDVNKFMDEVKDWDVLLLGGNNIRIPKLRTKYYIKINGTFGCPAYIIRKHYFKTYLDRLEHAENFIKSNPGNDDHGKYAADATMLPLQERDNWNRIFGNCVIQKPGISHEGIEGVSFSGDYYPCLTNLNFPENDMPPITE